MAVFAVCEHGFAVGTCSTCFMDEIARLRSEIEVMSKLHRETTYVPDEVAKELGEKDAEIYRLRAAIWSDDSTPEEAGQRTSEDAARFVSGLRAEISRLRAIIASIHEALGEDPGSDEATLAEGVRLILEGRQTLREDVERLTRERDSLRSGIDAALEIEGYADDDRIAFLVERERERLKAQMERGEARARVLQWHIVAGKIRDVLGKIEDAQDDFGK